MSKVSLNMYVFAVYVGLVAAGYDMSESSSNKEMIEEIKNMDWDNRITDYYQWTKNSTCEVNPYWPRAFILTLASLYVSDENTIQYKDVDEVMNHINSLDQIKLTSEKEEIEQRVKELPCIHNRVVKTPGFHGLWKAYCRRVKSEEPEYNRIIHQAMGLVREAFDLKADKFPSLIFVPNSLQAPEIADFVTMKNRVYVIQSKPNAVAIVHEYLHQIVGNKLDESADLIKRYTFLIEPVFEKMVKYQYAWDKDNDSWLNVFEENFIRAASIWIINRNNKEAAIKKANKYAADGFVYIPIILENFMNRWKGLKALDLFILECLNECKRSIN